MAFEESARLDAHGHVLDVILTRLNELENKVAYLEDCQRVSTPLDHPIAPQNPSWTRPEGPYCDERTTTDNTNEKVY